MKQFAQTYYLLQFIVCLICFSISCGEGGNDNYSETNDERNKEPEITVSPVTNLEAKSTQIANQLLITWQNPNTPNLLGVELSYLQKNGGTHNGKQIIQGAAGKTGNYTFQLPQYGTYEISAIAIDNYGHRSSAVTVIATPAETTVPFSWATLADSCTYVLIEQFMNKSKGTFWSTPKDISNESAYIYWQQAHAMDVVIYSYKRIKDTNTQLAATYRTYFERWYANHANNYHRNPSDETGFLNDFTDDMCWICLTLIHLSEATGDEKFAQTAKIVYDKYIITRAWTDDKGTGLPWNTTQNDRNACTNSPGCLVAAKLYQRYGDGNYLSDAKKLYEYVINNSYNADGRVEEPPLTYTQGTFGEACRQLYHITQESKYMDKAKQVINYAATSDRCLRNGILRDEGSSMDQSIFKSVYIPYAVNLALDEASGSIGKHLITFLKNNAETLRMNLNHAAYPAMYCNYWWGEMWKSSEPASMGAQVSGASLMEGIARLE